MTDSSVQIQPSTITGVYPTAAPTAAPVGMSKISDGEIAAAVIMSVVGSALICIGSYYLYTRCKKTPYAAPSAHGEDNVVHEETSVELNSRA